jgi:glycine hydroxymethyltransferase
VNHETGLIDYDQIRDMAKKCQPKLIIAGASAYPRAIDFKVFADIAHEVGAVLMVDMAHIAGLVAGGAHMSPVPYADIVTTTTHKTLRGPRGGLILAKEEFAKKLNSAVFPGTQGGPLEHVIAAKAVCFREAMQPEFKTYAQNIVKNAKVLASALLDEGFDLVTGGTDNHLMLADLRPMKITGMELQSRCDLNHITLNKNAIPGDPQKPTVTSGVRIGTAAVTTRGLGAEEMKQIARCVALTAKDFEGTQDEVKATVAEICRKYPLY